MSNRLDESLNEYLKRSYGNSLFKKKVIVEIIMELNSTKYEMKEVYLPEEEVYLKVRK
jgi:hypothetical protein